MNKIVIRPYIYTILLTLVIQGCESGESFSSISDDNTVEEASNQLLDQPITADKLAENAALDNIEKGTISGEKLANATVTLDNLSDA